MDEPRKHQVSLRGASVREISRDALLEKVSQERELRSYARRATAAAIFIQTVWRRYYTMKHEAVKLQEEWETTVNHYDGLMTVSFVSNSVLRPFLFFITSLSMRPQKICPRDVDCMQRCFKILLESISSTDSGKNFCSLALGTVEERRIWTYQARNLIQLCSFILAESDRSPVTDQDVVVLTALAMRFLVVLTDLKGWKCITNINLRDADIALRNLIHFMGSRKSGLYISVRRYISKLDTPYLQTNNVAQTDDKFLIIASAITLALRPVTKFDVVGPGLLDMQSPAVQCCLFLLTIPWLTQRLPAVLVPALKHKSILLPCLRTILMMTDSER